MRLLFGCAPAARALEVSAHSLAAPPGCDKKRRMTTFPCAAILFDLDGVLVDSTGSVDRQWRAWAREQGIDEDTVIAIAHGVRSVEVIRAVAPHLDAKKEARKLENREAGDRDGVVVMPGA